MSEWNFMDDMQFEEVDSGFLEPAAVQALLEQPADIVTVEGEDGELVTTAYNPTVEPGQEKGWEPDDVEIARDRADSETRPAPFRDPVEQDIIQGGRAS